MVSVKILIGLAFVVGLGFGRLSEDEFGWLMPIIACVVAILILVVNVKHWGS
jgi:divalent metal cation (Fe/Co/Zn/Cd) transporter